MNLCPADQRPVEIIMDLERLLARRVGLEKLAVPTQGNAGDSLCAYVKAAGMLAVGQANWACCRFNWGQSQVPEWRTLALDSDPMPYGLAASF